MCLPASPHDAARVSDARPHAFRLLQALAVKCVRRAHLETRDEYAMQTEVSVLRRVEHDKIVRLLEVVDTPKTCFMVNAIACIPRVCRSIVVAP